MSTSESIGRYLQVRRIPEEAGKPRWAVLSKTQGTLLGLVVWFPRWRQFVFEPAPDSVFNVDCLQDITRFIQRVAGDPTP